VDEAIKTPQKALGMLSWAAVERRRLEALVPM